MPYSTPTQAMLDLMYEAYYMGRNTVTHDGKTVRFESSENLWKAIQRYESLMTGAGAGSRVVRLRGGKGL